jgi:hypothetical protein
MALFICNIAKTSLTIDGKYLIKQEQNIKDERKKNLHMNMINQNMDFFV